MFFPSILELTIRAKFRHLWILIRTILQTSGKYLTLTSICTYTQVMCRLYLCVVLLVLTQARINKKRNFIKTFTCIRCLLSTTPIDIPGQNDCVPRMLGLNWLNVRVCLDWMSRLSNRQLGGMVHSLQQMSWCGAIVQRLSSDNERVETCRNGSKHVQSIQSKRLVNTGASMLSGETITFAGKSDVVWAMKRWNWRCVQKSWEKIKS